MPSVVIASAGFVAMWGSLLYQGVTDPLGGINSLWPLFGIANQLLAAVAMCVGTTVILKMGKGWWALATAGPLAWLVTITFTTGVTKIFSADPKLGFLSHARMLAAALDRGTLPVGVTSADAARRMIGNDWLDAAVAGFFLSAVTVILIASAYEWYSVLVGREHTPSTEVELDAVTAFARTSGACDWRFRNTDGARGSAACPHCLVTCVITATRKA
jgi:carbon starvation protein